MKKTTSGPLTLLEILVKTHYLIAVTEPNDRELEDPIYFGSGFMIDYKNTIFFVTADHVLHPEDHVCNLRNGVDNVISIYNNVRPNTNYLSTVCTPLGGFYYMDSFDITKPGEMSKPIDVTICIMKPINLQYPFLTDEKEFQNEETGMGQQKFILMEENLVEPNEENQYFVYGKIKTDLKGILLHRDNTIKENMKFIDKSGDYFLFNTTKDIKSYDEWSGLSGSPVIDNYGGCVGVLCSVKENSKAVYVMPIEKVKLLMDIALTQEKLPQNNVNI